MSNKIATITGIVLAGGKSTRMQRDKGLIDYHGKAQREYTYQMLQEVCAQVFYSCREDQLTALTTVGFKAIPDRFPEKGPLGALWSVFNEDPITAKLVSAIDLPYLDKSTLQFLVDSRDPDKMATAFRNPFDQKPEPLLAIWGPKSYPLFWKAILMIFLISTMKTR